MPLINQEIANDRAWGLWRIEEQEAELVDQIRSIDPIPESIKHPIKRLEFYSGRLLIQSLMNGLGYFYQGLIKDDHGKPYFINHAIELSLSHSYPYVTAILDKTKPVGIDLEQIKTKLIRIAPRILNKDELTDAGQDPVKLTLYWCAKESLVKVYGKKDLSFSENIRINPFFLKEKGTLAGRIIKNNQVSEYSLHYQLSTDYALVYTL
jgi:phosphopantetheinyl transferase